MDAAAVIAVIAAVLVVGGVAAAITATLVVSGRRRREREGAESAALERLERDAGVALVRADERLRLAADEADFAAAEFGPLVAEPFRAAIDEARTRLAEAFHLNQLLHDHLPDSAAERRRWSTRIVELAGSVDRRLGEHAHLVAAHRDDQARLRRQVAAGRADAEAMRARIDLAAEALVDLGDRFAPEALRGVAGAPDQATRLVGFAVRSLDAAAVRAADGRPDDAGAMVQAASESLARASGLLEAVADFERAALAAEHTLAAMIDDSYADLAAARRLAPERRAVAADAIAALERALATAAASDAHRDPIGRLSALREANAALDSLVAGFQAQDERTRRVQAQLSTALADAEHQIGQADAMLAGRSAEVRADARTRLAEARRLIDQAQRATDPGEALETARRAASLAAEARNLAGYDIDLARQQGSGGWSSGGGRRTGRDGSELGAAIGGVLGGMVLGGLLDKFGDLGDLGDLFD